MLAQSVLDGYNVSDTMTDTSAVLIAGLHFRIWSDRFRKVVDDGRRTGEPS